MREPTINAELAEPAEKNRRWQPHRERLGVFCGFCVDVRGASGASDQRGTIDDFSVAQRVPNGRERADVFGCESVFGQHVLKLPSELGRRNRRRIRPLSFEEVTWLFQKPAVIVSPEQSMT